MNRLVAGLLVALSISPSAMAAGLIEESIMLPASFPWLIGTHVVKLDALVIRPDDDERHPLAVINHGTPRDASDRQRMSARDFRGQAREFASRGWVAVSFTRRGYGASAGEDAEFSGNCSTAFYAPAGRRSAEDVREVIRLMKEKPYVDGAKVVSVGRSSGGFATVALTADPPPGLVAAINFAGGRGSIRPDEVCNPSGLIEAFAVFGRTSRVPMLWVYAENDHYFGLDLAKRFYQAFTAGGGKAEFIAAPVFGRDGHSLFTRVGTPIWSIYVDSFLEAQNLRLVDRPSSIDADIRYPSGLNERGKTAFLDFLDARGHKAFVVSANGRFGWRSGRENPEDAVEQAMKLCKQDNTQPCRSVMVDDAVQ
jgi:dienelactone hydrolase